MSEFCYLFNPSFQVFPPNDSYNIEFTVEKEFIHTLSIQNWGPSNLHIDLDESQPWLDENDPTMLRLTIVNNSQEGQMIILRYMVLSWLIDLANGEPDHKYLIHPGEAITLQTAINDITNKKSWWPIEPVNPEYYTEPM
jgi:hypothetical protein